MQEKSEVKQEDSSLVILELLPEPEFQEAPWHEWYELMLKDWRFPLSEKKLLELKLQKSTALNKPVEEIGSDLDVIHYFLHIKMSKTHRLKKPLALVNLWPGKSDEEKRDRYCSILSYLMQRQLNHIDDGMNLKLSALQEYLTALEHMQTLLTLDVSESGLIGPAQSWTERVNGWFMALSNSIRGIFSRRVQIDVEKPAYADIGNRMFHLAQTLEIPGDKLDFLMAWYERGRQHFSTKVLACASYPSPSPSLFFNWNKYVSDLRKNLENDLKTVRELGSYQYKESLLERAQNGRESLDGYLSAYKASNAKLQTFSEQVWSLRERCEEKCRKYKSQDYLNKLNSLDKMLSDLHAQILALNEDWFKANEALCIGDGVIVEANQLLRKLEDKEIQSLKWVPWVEHTCYDQYAERDLAFEMNKRNKVTQGRYFGKPEEGARLTYYDRPFNSHEYNLETVITATDYALEEIRKNNKKQKQILIGLHPDKLAPELQEVGSFCTTVINGWRGKADKLSQLWMTSQWAARPQEDLLNEEIKQEAQLLQYEDIVKVEKPTIGLDLSALVLHEKYLQWIKSEADAGRTLSKRTDQVPFTQAFFATLGKEKDSELDRYLFAQMQRDIVKTDHLNEGIRELKKKTKKERLARKKANFQLRKAEENQKDAEEYLKETEEKTEKLKEKLKQQAIFSFLGTANDMIEDNFTETLLKKLDSGELPNNFQIKLESILQRLKNSFLSLDDFFIEKEVMAILEKEAYQGFRPYLSASISNLKAPSNQAPKAAMFGEPEFNKPQEFSETPSI